MSGSWPHAATAFWVTGYRIGWQDLHELKYGFEESTGT